jgi:hypothetical protein
MMPDTAQTPTLSNAAFLTHLGEDRPSGSFLWVTCFTGSPDLTDASNWGGQPLTPSTPVDQWGGLNTYFSVANLKPNLDGEILRRRVNFASLAALVVDDVLLVQVLVTDQIPDLERQKMESLLRLGGLKLGLLVNFQVPVMRKGIERFTVKRRSAEAV